MNVVDQLFRSQSGKVWDTGGSGKRWFIFGKKSVRGYWKVQVVVR